MVNALGPLLQIEEQSHGQSNKSLQKWYGTGSSEVLVIHASRSRQMGFKKHGSMMGMLVISARVLHFQVATDCVALRSSE
jgi:hypothetical protein